MSARHLALAAFWCLLALQPAWQLLLSPAKVLPPLLVTALLTLPLLPPAIGLLLRRPSALFWGGVIALLHFCHGIMELWTDRSVIGLALAQVGLSTGLIAAIGWDGLQKRRAQRAASQAPRAESR
ncbi:MAG: DUF2069 domain-containing protein [Pseudomarimonas sp.]